MTIKDLAIKHDYYCSDHNYYSNDAQTTFANWPEHLEAMNITDEDLNLVFRWDVKQHDGGGYYMELFIMHQRKGRFWPVMIESVTDADADSIVQFLSRHWAKMQRLWCPLSIADLAQVPDPVERAR